MEFEYQTDLDDSITLSIDDQDITDAATQIVNGYLRQGRKEFLSFAAELSVTDEEIDEMELMYDSDLYALKNKLYIKCETFWRDSCVERAQQNAIDRELGRD